MIGDDMLSTLNLGPSFSVSQPVTQATLDAVLCTVQKFADLRWRYHRGPTATSLFQDLSSLEAKLTQMDLLRISSKTHVSNMTVAERNGLRKLIRIKDKLRFTVGDKCGGFLVTPKMMDKELTKITLTDTTAYENETTKRTFDTLSQHL
ncbi:hypothetical protein Aduo_015957 [Ancylostoma duodenale]